MKPNESIRSIRAKQALVLTLGFLLTATMVFLGLWQMRSYLNSGDEAAWARTRLPAVPFSEVSGDENKLMETYGRTVSVECTFNPDLQFLAGLNYPLRVATGCELADGAVLVVVRGSITDGDQVPPPPDGRQSFSGILLASDVHDPPAQSPGLPANTWPNIRLQRVVQQWPGQVLPGYVSVTEDYSREQGLQKAEVELPRAEGRAQNSGYALQWWVFAGFTIVVTVLSLRKLSRQIPRD